MWQIIDYDPEISIIHFKSDNHYKYKVDYIINTDRFLCNNRYYSLNEIKENFPSFQYENIINKYRRFNNYVLFMFKHRLFKKSELKQKINIREFKNTDLGKKLNNDVLQLIFSFIW
jgi:hypothetical protein